MKKEELSLHVKRIRRQLVCICAAYQVNGNAMKKCRAVPNREVASACIISGEQNQPLRTILELEEIKSYEIRAETLKQRTTVFNLTSRQAGKFGILPLLPVRTRAECASH